MTYYSDEAFPAPSDEQWARLQSYGSAQEVESGALLWGAGEAYDLILVDSGEAEVIKAATARAAEAVVARFNTGPVRRRAEPARQAGDISEQPALQARTGPPDLTCLFPAADG
jgi:hypothetical protein